MPEETSFSWSDNHETVVVEAVEAIAVYKNSNGQVVIRQQDSTGQQEGDSFILIPIDRVQDVIRALQSQLEN